MAKVKIINLGYDAKLIVPDSVSPKDLQALVGFLGTLQKADRSSNWQGADWYYADRFVNFQLEEVELVSKDEATRLSKESKAAYDAKTALDKAAAEA